MQITSETVYRLFKQLEVMRVAVTHYEEENAVSLRGSDNAK